MDSFIIKIWDWVVAAAPNTAAIAFEAVEGRAIDPVSIDYYEIEVEAGRPARLQFQGLASGELSIFVFSSSLRLIAAGESTGQVCNLGWNADQTGRAIVTVRNTGLESNRYALRATARFLPSPEELEPADSVATSRLPCEDVVLVDASSSDRLPRFPRLFRNG